MSPPTGYGQFIRSLPGCSQYDEQRHELELLKPVYGLKDAPRCWRARLHTALVELHAFNLSTDHCIYVWRNSSGLISAIASAHVDDLKLAGEASLVEKILAHLSELFGKLKIARGSFEHCGIWHEIQKDGSYHLHQRHFADRMKLIDLSEVSLDKPTEKLNDTQVSVFLSALGSLAWLIQTRLDIAIYVQALQRSAKNPTVAHMHRLSCVIRWCKRKPVHLFYSKLRTEQLRIACISDAAFRREDSSGLAMRGSIIGLAERHENTLNCQINVLDFYSRRQRRICRSTFGVELNSASDGVEVAKMIAFTLAELLIPSCTPRSLLEMEENGTLPVKICLATDCRSLFDALRVDETQVPTEQSLVMLLMQIKENLRTRTIEVIAWVDTRDMIADGLNKGCIARRGLLEFSMTGLWKLLHPYVVHTEPKITPIISVRADALS